jgi:capsular exopolysaccharide synthesis family protein
MSDNRSLQRVNSDNRAWAIMTPQGPAIIQVIDIPSGPLGMAGPAMGAARKPGGINILGAILRRWWLVVLVTALIGGAGIYAANNFVKPVYIAHAKISWIDRTGSPDGQGMQRLIAQATDVLTSREIPLLAAADSEMHQAYPVLATKDLQDPAVQAEVTRMMKDAVVADSVKQFQTVDLQATRQNPVEAARVANAFSRAFVTWVQNQLKGDIESQIAQADQACKDSMSLKAALSIEKTKLMVDNKIDQDALKQTSTMHLATQVMDEQLKAKTTLAMAQAKLKELESKGSRPEYDLARLELVEQEKAKDNLLQTYNAQLVSSVSNLEQAKITMTAEHPEVMRLMDSVNRAKAQVLEREAQIASIIQARIDQRFKLTDLKTVAEAKEAVARAEAMLVAYDKQLADLDKRTKEMVFVKNQITAIDDRIALATRDHDASYGTLQTLKNIKTSIDLNSGIKIAEYAVPPEVPDQDKRVKVQAAGMVGGLFLGMLLALLVDKFDRRLRDPRDVEPLLGAPLLGTIPRIGELKRVKGEQARNLIAEEFRIIRTQLLFGNPEMNHKVIAVTSPQPGDGKTSLAVNLAISIAKAGRRVLLIDGDLRKPDIHRIFNVADSPGFAEVIAGSHEPAAVIKKSDIDGLDVLPAGTPITRPSELLSRPDVSRVLAALGEVYDHIVLDTAPLLPVSDTHVLVGLVDGVLTSFNADVDRNTVVLVQDILRRSRANVIGTVMNQVKYKQSGSYHRGKSAYSSYYTSTRVPAGSLPSKPDPNVATLTKH